VGGACGGRGRILDRWRRRRNRGGGRSQRGGGGRGWWGLGGWLLRGLVGSLSWESLVVGRLGRTIVVAGVWNGAGAIGGSIGLRYLVVDITRG